MVCEKVFQEEGVFADVTLAEYPLDFIPFDSDILSLELDTAYKASFCPPWPCYPIRLLLFIQTLAVQPVGWILDVGPRVILVCATFWLYRHKP